MVLEGTKFKLRAKATILVSRNDLSEKEKTALRLTADKYKRHLTVTEEDGWFILTVHSLNVIISAKDEKVLNNLVMRKPFSLKRYSERKIVVAA